MQLTSPLLPHQAFLTEPAWQFAFGHVFQPKGHLTLDGPELPANEIGYWRCEIDRGNRLSWTDRVYQLFGLPIDDEIARDAAVQCYSPGSRAVLERLRTFSIGNQCGFLLDAKMCPKGNGSRNLRVLSVPVMHEGRVVAIHGLKRAL